MNEAKDFGTRGVVMLNCVHRVSAGVQLAVELIQLCLQPVAA
jgi:hypothetical protein